MDEADGDPALFAHDRLLDRGISIREGSLKTNVALANEIPCLRKLASALVGSHSNSTLHDPIG